MKEKNKNYWFIEGKFLIASPNISDPSFPKPLYMISDSINGSMGIIVNRPAINVNLKNFFDLEKFDIKRSRIFNSLWGAC